VQIERIFLHYGTVQFGLSHLIIAFLVDKRGGMVLKVFYCVPVFILFSIVRECCSILLLLSYLLQFQIRLLAFLLVSEIFYRSGCRLLFLSIRCSVFLPWGVGCRRH